MKPADLIIANANVYTVDAENPAAEAVAVRGNEMGERPLLLMAFDYHTLWTNTAALEQAGLLHGAADLPGSAEIVLGPDGLATGELREEAAYGRLLHTIPEPGDNRKRELLKNGLAYLASLGVTSVHNMNGDAAKAALYAALEDLGELSLRVYVPYSIRPETPLSAIAAEAVPLRQQFQSEMVRAGAVKFFMDGVYESYTAVTLDAYPDQPDNFGAPIYSPEHFARMAIEADKHGLQIFVHACGDGAVRRVLDGYTAVRQTNGRRNSRHRVEHIEMIHPDDAPRLAQLGVIASMQPLHAPLEADSDDVWLKRVRPSQWDRAFAWRTLRDANAVLAFGSDWPVAPPNPLWGIAGAVTRQPWQPGVNPHRQTLAEAIAAYTRDAAYAEFQEDQKGQIKAGMWADMVLLTDDIFALPPEELWHIRVALTVCNGRVVYEK
ncbi:MAG: amidohydrolase [Chloroflexi bacterium]|nr:amidohydrolase [Chloroflexota bacterium]